MGFTKKTWKDRVTEFPTRRTLTKSDNTTELVTVERTEGTVSEEGDTFSATNMNDFEARIETGFEDLGDCTFSVQSDGAYVTYTPTGGADAVTKKLGEPVIIDCGSNTTINIADYYDGDISDLTANNFILAITSTSISGNNTGQMVTPNSNPISGAVKPVISYNSNTGIVSITNTTGSFTSNNGASYYVNVTVAFKVFLIAN